MKKYAVKLNNKILNNTVIVKAERFMNNPLSSYIVFVDDEGTNVALFKQIDVRHITLI